jgi:hypothetical protein
MTMVFGADREKIRQYERQAQKQKAPVEKPAKPPAPPAQSAEGPGATSAAQKGT